jgi:aspartate-semialdehyde dehydrogenase
VEHYGSDLWKPQNFPEEFMAVRVQSLAEVLLENKCKIALSFIAPEHGAVEGTYCVGPFPNPGTAFTAPT